MEIKTLLLVPLTLVLQLSKGTTNEEAVDCLDAAYCSLIKGDLAKESTKYNNNPMKYYSESEGFLTKATEYNKSMDDSVLKMCQSAYKICSDEAVSMAVDGLGFPEAYRTICSFEEYSRTIFGCQNIKNWPAAVRKSLPYKRISCRRECILVDGENYTLINGKALVRIPVGESMNMTDLPDDLESRVHSEVDWINRPVARPEIQWQQVGYGPGSADERELPEVCPPNSWVDTVYNMDIPAGQCPRLHVDFVCRSSADLGTRNNQGHILGAIAIKLAINLNKTNEVIDTIAGSNKCGYVTLNRYDNCNGINGTTQHTFLTGISWAKQVFNNAAGVHRINYRCGDSKNWNPKNGKVDSIPRVCPPEMAVCGVRTIIATIKSTDRDITEIKHVRDVTIGCCPVDDIKYITTALPSLPATQPPVMALPSTPAPVVLLSTDRPSVATEGENGLFYSQRNFLLYWAGVLNNRITRYNYFYSPHTIDHERDWETTKCADGTFVNGFEVTNPISIYHWTRRIMVIKFKCGAMDGSKTADLDLYTKLKTAKYGLQEPDLNEKSDCGGGYYSAIEIIYYLDNTREKSVLVNAWAIIMNCTKGASTEPHKHLANSTPRNIISDNTIQNGVVDCGNGKAICGFVNKLSENRRGAFEGLYYRVICCSV